MNFFQRHRHVKRIIEHRDYLLERVEELKRENEHLRKALRMEYQVRDPCRICNNRCVIERVVNNVVVIEPCECTRT